MSKFSEGIERGKEQSISRQVGGSEEKFSDYPIPYYLSYTIAQLHLFLQREFGSDYAFTIMGKGHILAASNYAHGRITPKVKA